MVVWLPVFHIHPIENAKPLFYTKTFSDFQKYHFFIYFQKEKSEFFWEDVLPDFEFLDENIYKTRMHSSRMRIVRSSSRPFSRGGCLVPGDVWSMGVPGPGGCYPSMH